jgi:ComF family protein
MLIQGYKFSQQLRLLPCLSDCLIQQIQSVKKNKYQLPDALIAVPLHPYRLRQRGFNQSLLLANRVAKHFNIPVLKHLVIRAKNTGEQAALNRKQRLSNITNAFEIHPSNLKDLSKYNKVAIIDDVITSGSTCNELARLLKRSGIAYIDIWCVAKTPFIK